MQIPLAPVSIGVSIALVNVADVAGTCSAIETCLSNSRNLMLVIAKVHVPNAAFPNPTAPAFTTGTYKYANLADLANIPIDVISPDPVTGNISIFTGGVESVGASPACPLTGGYGISAGTMTITTVSGSTLTGTVSVNLVDGLGAAAGTLSGTFTTATNCTPSPAPSACTLLSELIPVP